MVLFLFREGAITHPPLKCGGGTSQSNDENETVALNIGEKGKNESSPSPPKGENDDVTKNDSLTSDKVIFFPSRELKESKFHNLKILFSWKSAAHLIGKKPKSCMKKDSYLRRTTLTRNSPQEVIR